MTKYTFNEKNYKKRTKKRNLSFVVIIFFIITLSIISFFIAPKYTNVDRFYFVEIDSFLTYSDASKLATKIQQQSGAGYIYYDEKYRVLASFYLTEKEAESVIKNISSDYSHSRVYTLDIHRFSSLNNLSKKQNEIIISISDLLLNTIQRLSELSVAFDTNSKSLDSILLEINTLRTSFDSVRSKFLSLFHQDSTYNANKVDLQEIANSLERISKSNNSQFGQTIKFETINIIINYSSFLSF